MSEQQKKPTRQQQATTASISFLSAVCLQCRRTQISVCDFRLDVKRTERATACRSCNRDSDIRARAHKHTTTGAHICREFIFCSVDDGGAALVIVVVVDGSYVQCENERVRVTLVSMAVHKKNVLKRPKSETENVHTHTAAAVGGAHKRNTHNQMTAPIHSYTHTETNVSRTISAVCATKRLRILPDDFVNQKCLVNQSERNLCLFSLSREK